MSERAYSAAKPIFMFMQHPQHVYALFVKSALFGTKGAKLYYGLKMSGNFKKDNPLHQQYERDFKVNRDTVVGILSTHLLMGGIAGAMFEPTKWALGFALMINELLTGEPPEDTKVYVHRWTTSLFGQEGAELAMHGLPTMLGMNLSQNLSLSNLATFDTRFKEGREGFQDRVFAALGPLPALAGNVLEGISNMKDGNLADGLARMSPRMIREAIRAANSASMGIRDNRGNILIDAKDLSPYELFLSSMGISTAQKSQMYEDRGATLNLKYAEKNKVIRLKKRLNGADTPGKKRAAVAAIHTYNRRVPFSQRISIPGTEAAAARSQRIITKGGGVHLTRNEQYLKQEI